MSLFHVFEISGSALAAQGVRLNTIASNLANAEVASGTAEGAFRSRQPIFTTAYATAMSQRQAVGVRVDGIVESTAPPRQRYSPSHPLADRGGFIYLSNVNTVEEMANMISASRSYQSNIEAMNTTKELIMRTLSLGS